eukprot:7986835-Alexandrium_andersonii.AAC.1
MQHERGGRALAGFLSGAAASHSDAPATRCPPQPPQVPRQLRDAGPSPGPQPRDGRPSSGDGAVRGGIDAAARAGLSRGPG